MDVRRGREGHPTLDAFTKRTGIKVKYTEDINDNDEFFGKIKPQLAAGQDTGRDLIVVTDWLAARLIRLGWVAEARPGQPAARVRQPLAAVPHPRLGPGPRVLATRGPASRPSSPTTTRRPAAAKVDSVTQLLDDPKLKGRVAFLSEMRDSVGMTLLDMGKDPANVHRRRLRRRDRPPAEGRRHEARSAASPATTTPRT